MQLYMITNRRLFAGGPDEAMSALLNRALPWVKAGLNYLQVREKDLHPTSLWQMATTLRGAVQGTAHRLGLPPPAVLVNAGDEQQIQAACKVADGVHLPGDARPLVLRVQKARALWKGERPGGRTPVISVSCHTMAEVEEARRARVSVILFAPVFEKPLWEEPAAEPRRPEGLEFSGPRSASFAASRLAATLPGVGLAALRSACAAAAPVPVFALGGVTLENAGECVAAGAAGIAGVRLFAGDGWRHLVAP